MIVGIPKEIKSDEYRISLLPVGAELLTRDGHTVLVERNAGTGSGYDDAQYVEAGATIVDDVDGLWAKADMIVKVKEPQPEEIKRMRPGQEIFTYFHLAADKDLTIGCMESGATCIAYETLEARAPGGRTTLPLLTPMSEVAGKMSVQEGAKYLERPQEGRGILLGGVPGVEPGNVIVLGGGVVGSNAARMAAGLGANVVIMDIDLDRLRYLSEVMPANVTTVYSDPHAIRHHLVEADLVIGAVLIPAAKAPNLITRADLKLMKPGAVIVDVAVDQGGCVETTKPTTHKDPTYMVDGVLHYCVANMPGAVGRTSTQALTHATQPWVLKIANEGSAAMAALDEYFRPAINCRDGKLTNQPVAEAHDLEMVSI
jgi:alanine dehydrogenase